MKKNRDIILICQSNQFLTPFLSSSLFTLFIPSTAYVFVMDNPLPDTAYYVIVTTTYVDMMISDLASISDPPPHSPTPSPVLVFYFPLSIHKCSA